MKDSYRDIYPNITDFTWEQSTDKDSPKSRIDRFYVEKEEKITRYTHTKVDKTDHKAVFIEINSNNKTKANKSPHWVLNNSLLENKDYITLIECLIQNKINKMESEPKFLDFWDTFKEEIKIETIDFATKVNRERKKRKIELESIIDKAYKNNQQDEKNILQLKEELEKINEHIYKGAKLRTTHRTNVPDEKLTATYLNIERGTQKARIINELQTENGEMITNETKIRDILTKHYETLFKKETTDENAQNEILNNMTKLSNIQSDLLDIEMNETILYEALKTLEKDKTPGPDGLTTEFFNTFFLKLKPLFTKLVNTIYDEEYLAYSQTLSIIKLIPKDTTQKTIKNLRPISLLNVDYKIITKALTLKLLKVMDDLVHPDQNCSVPDRRATDATAMVRDIITYNFENGTQSLILSMDMMGAFDRVAHDFIHKVLKELNIGPYFRKWIEIIYKNPYSCLLVNNKFTKLFPIERSVKQGDPISSLIFVLTLEPFLEKVRQNKDIKGIKIPGGENKKCIAYADDTNFILSNYSSINKVIEIFTLYSKASGAKINKQKTKAMAIGPLKPSNLNCEWLEWVKEIKILGIYFQNSRNPGTKKQWETILNKIITRINKFGYKHTTIFSRTFLLNTFVLPKLNYQIQTLNIQSDILKEIEKEIYNYAYHKKTIQGIARNTLIQLKENGGTQINDTTSKQKAYRIQHIRNIIQNPQKHPFGIYYLGNFLKKEIKFDNHFPHFGYENKLPLFYETCIDNFKEFPNILETTENVKDIYRRIIKTKAPNLNNRIKEIKHYPDTNIKEIFNNLHKSKLNARQKEITYRLIFQITPVYQFHKGVCNLCKQKDSKETEHHLFFTCPNIQDIKIELNEQIYKQTQQREDLFRVIFLNTTTEKASITDKKIIMQLTAAYRETIWTLRCRGLDQHTHITPITLLNNFESKIDVMQGV